MTSNYALYIKEKLGRDIVEYPFGFFTYSPIVSDLFKHPDTKILYVYDAFIRKESRGFKHIRMLGDMQNMARHHKSELIVCSVSLKDEKLVKYINLYTKLGFDYMNQIVDEGKLYLAREVDYEEK